MSLKVSELAVGEVKVLCAPGTEISAVDVNGIASVVRLKVPLRYLGFIWELMVASGFRGVEQKLRKQRLTVFLNHVFTDSLDFFLFNQFLIPI